jgi:enterochelin esterase-like enzyme
MRRPATVLFSTAVLALGFFGTWSYVHNYVVYRGFAPPRDPPGVAAGTLRSVSIYSPALKRRDSYLIYLPAGYAAAARHGTRFPVLYLLHGTASGAMHFVNVGQVGVDVDTLLARRRIHPLLVVMPSAQDGSFVDDTEWANTPHGRYESALLDVVRAVDRRWPTRPTRDARAVAGLSMGGYGSMNIALHHLRLFATAESWSGYFTQTRSGPFAAASRRTLRANSPAIYARAAAPTIRRLGLHVLLYRGGRDPVAAPQAPFAHELRAVGASVRTLRASGAHSWRLWRNEMPLALRFADRWLGAPRRAAAGHGGRAPR